MYPYWIDWMRRRKWRQRRRRGRRPGHQGDLGRFHRRRGEELQAAAAAAAAGLDPRIGGDDEEPIGAGPLASQASMRPSFRQPHQQEPGLAGSGGTRPQSQGSRLLRSSPGTRRSRCHSPSPSKPRRAMADLLPRHGRSPSEVIGPRARGAGCSMAAPTPLRTLHPLPGTRRTLSVNLGHKSQVSLPKTSPANRRPSPNLVPSPKSTRDLASQPPRLLPFIGRGPQRP